MKIINTNMRKIPIAFILLFFILTNIQSQPASTNYSLADRIAIAAPDTFATIESLTDYLCKDFHSELLKTRAIYFWIINHIEYDDKLTRKSKNYSSKVSPELVYEKRKTICAGYAELFTKMCDFAGIRSTVTYGYTNTNDDFDYRVGDFFFKPDHEWNIVEIDDVWYHIDLTYDTDNLISSDDSLDFLLTSDELLKTRLPACSFFQLRMYPYSLEEFAKDSMIATENHSQPPCAFRDSIDYFLGLSSLQRELYLGKQIYRFNPACTDYYVIALNTLADSILSAEVSSRQELYSNLMLVRNTYYETLKYLLPTRVFFREKDKVYCFKEPFRKKNIRGMKKMIAFIERKYFLKH
jgi:hypothetical protein